MPLTCPSPAPSSEGVVGCLVACAVPSNSSLSPRAAAAAKRPQEFGCVICRLSLSAIICSRVCNPCSSSSHSTAKTLLYLAPPTNASLTPTHPLTHHRLPFPDPLSLCPWPGPADACTLSISLPLSLSPTRPSSLASPSSSRRSACRPSNTTTNTWAGDSHPANRFGANATPMPMPRWECQGREPPGTALGALPGQP